MQATPVKNGLILGGILVIASLGMCLISKPAYIQYSSMIFFFVVLFFMIKMGRDARAINGGTLTFSEAFKAIFVGSAIAFIICTAFRYFLFNFIFPDLPEVALGVTMEMTDSIMDWASDFGGEEVAEQMEVARDDIETQLTADQFEMTIGNSLLELTTRLVFPGIVVGMIAALITKKETSV